jgi:hypothetical protein
LAAVLTVTALWALGAVPAPTTSASWVKSVTSAGPNVSTKKVMSQTVESRFLDWNDAYDGSPAGRQGSGVFYVDANTGTSNDPMGSTWNSSYYDYFTYMGEELPDNVVASNVVWHFSFASATAGDSTCFYVVVRNLTTNTNIGTHGSTGSTLGCVGTTATTYSVALSEITNTSVIKDHIAVRVFMKNAGNKVLYDANWITGDLMYNNGTQSYDSFEVFGYDRYANQAVTVSPPWLSSWGLAKFNDGTNSTSYVVTSGGNIPASATGTPDPTKYLEFDQPPSPWAGFIPTGATITASNIKISFDAAVASGANMCVRLDIYVGGVNQLNAKSTGAGCSTGNAANTQFTVDTSSIISTPAQANNVYVRASVGNTGTLAKIAVDYVALGVTYSLN